MILIPNDFVRYIMTQTPQRQLKKTGVKSGAPGGKQFLLH